MRFSTLADWLQWQEQLHPTDIELGLSRVQQVAERLLRPSYNKNNTQHSLSTVTVAGTNGKGSCVAYLEQILLCAGYRVGVYTSPHFLRYNERIRINGEEISDGQLCAAFERVDQARQQVSLTYFEFGTLAALDTFQREQLDIQILEVGLGGRLDATNIVDPDIAIITPIALDHQAWLGDNRESIGREKAGIFRPGIPLIVGDSSPPASVLQRARELGNQNLSLIGQHFCLESNSEAAAEQHWHFSSQSAGSGAVDWPELPLGKLPGPSAACALQAALELGIRDHEVIARGLQSATLTGRLQQLACCERVFFLDVAHNPHAASYVLEQLQQRGLQPSVMVFSALDDKDLDGLMAVLASLNCPLFTACLQAPRSASVEKICQSAAVRGVETRGFDTIGAALREAVSVSNPGECVLVCGSFFTVAEALQTLEQAR